MMRDKAELTIDGQPLYARAIAALSSVTEFVYASARADSRFLNELEVPVLYDDFANIGPAAALLRAHREAPLEEWLVLACDFPNVTDEALQFLKNRHRASNSTEITCYMHADGTPEPLFSIWSSTALRRLRDNVKTGLTSPIKTLKSCEVQLITSTTEGLLFNTNTPQEWALNLDRIMMAQPRMEFVMALTDDQKKAAANKPGQHVGQSQDQVLNDDANPVKDNLASEGDLVKSGRDLDSQPGASAPGVDKRPKTRALD